MIQYATMKRLSYTAAFKLKVEDVLCSYFALRREALIFGSHSCRHHTVLMLYYSTVKYMIPMRLIFWQII